MLGSLYCASGDTAGAERLLLDATQILKRSVGQDHPDYGLSLQHLARLSEATGEYARASRSSEAPWRSSGRRRGKANSASP